MNIKGIEKAEGKVCTKCGVWKPLEEYNKKKSGKYGKDSKCRECQKEYGKQWRENNTEYKKQYYQNNKEYHKQYRENNKEHRRKINKQYYQNNKEKIKEKQKQYHENNKEYYKKYGKQWYKNNKQNNLQYISSIVEQVNPIFEKLNLPMYGYIYMFENVKTGHRYVGQSIKPITRRYIGGVVQGWIKERLKYDNQKFKDELIEEDFKVTDVLDVAFCQYHLDKLEAYYINKYNSCENGYNNREGNHNTDDGIEEFNQILSDHNLEFKDGKLIQIKNTHP